MPGCFLGVLCASAVNQDSAHLHQACFANSEVGLVGELAVFGWRIQKGAWQGTSLDGFSVVGAVRASYTLGVAGRSPYPIKSVLIVDVRANPEQRLALR